MGSPAAPLTPRAHGSDSPQQLASGQSKKEEWLGLRGTPPHTGREGAAGERRCVRRVPTDSLARLSLHVSSLHQRTHIHSTEFTLEVNSEGLGRGRGGGSFFLPDCTESQKGEVQGNILCLEFLARTGGPDHPRSRPPGSRASPGALLRQSGIPTPSPRFTSHGLTFHPHPGPGGQGDPRTLIQEHREWRKPARSSPGRGSQKQTRGAGPVQPRCTPTLRFTPRTQRPSELRALQIPGRLGLSFPRQNKTAGRGRTASIQIVGLRKYVNIVY